MFLYCTLLFFFFKQKTAYEMRISDWSSDVCSSDLVGIGAGALVRYILHLDLQRDLLAAEPRPRIDEPCFRTERQWLAAEADFIGDPVRAGCAAAAFKHPCASVQAPRRPRIAAGAANRNGEGPRPGREIEESDLDM